MVLILASNGWAAAADRGHSQASAAPPGGPQDSLQQLKDVRFEDLFDVEVTTVSRAISTIGQSAAAVTVISAEDIRRSGATTIPELLRRVPGMTVARIDNNKWAVSARGFNQRFFGKMLVQIDGRSLYNPFTSGVYWDAVDYPLEDIDRIEVIRGPRAGVWGANAVNGIVNIITKPVAATQGGLLALTAGTSDRGGGTLRYGGAARGVRYRVYGKAFTRDDQFSLTGATHDAWLGGSGGVRMDWNRDPLNQVTIQADYLHSAANRRDLRAQPAPPYSFANFDTEATHNFNLLGRWKRTLSDDSIWTLQVYSDTFRRFSENLAIAFRWDTHDVDFQHQFAAGKRQRLLWGGSYRVVNSWLGDSAGDQGFLFHLTQEHHTDQTLSAYVQDEITVVPSLWTLSLNARFEHNAFTGFEIQPGVQVLFTPARQRTIWASVARAVRTPNLNEFYASPRLLPSASEPPVFPRQTPNTGIRSESVVAYQFGVRAQSAANGSIDAAVFYNVYGDLPAVRPGAPLPGPAGLDLPITPINGLDARTYGAELSALWRVRERWRFNAGYTFLEMNLIRRAGLPPSSEAAEDQSPQHQVHLHTYLDLTDTTELDLQGRWVGRLSGFNPGGAPGVADAVPSYFSADVRLAWRPRTALELSLIGQNLLDQHHPEFGTSSLVRSPLVEIRRGAYAKVAWRF